MDVDDYVTSFSSPIGLSLRRMLTLVVSIPTFIVGTLQRSEQV